MQGARLGGSDPSSSKLQWQGTPNERYETYLFALQAELKETEIRGNRDISPKFTKSPIYQPA